MTTESGSPFRILDTVGKGGFGTVYRAEYSGSGGFRKIVALKVLNPDLADQDELAERLRDEARILGLLNHRAIVKVDGLERIEGRWTVVMEFVEGVDLKRVVEDAPMPAGCALEIVEEVASALDSAYTMPGPDGVAVQLLHRDIKPSNIQLTARGEVKVLDFGVARADFGERESVTRSMFFGSVGYMAPERMDGIDTHGGDVYALGVVLAELILGTALGRSWSNPDRHAKHRDDILARLWAVCPDDGVYDLIGRCLAYEPEDRPTARVLARELRSLRGRLGAPWLRDWAELEVPRLARTRSTGERGSSGTLAGHGSARPEATDVSGEVSVGTGTLMESQSSVAHRVAAPSDALASLESLSQPVGAVGASAGSGWSTTTSGALSSPDTVAAESATQAPASSSVAASSPASRKLILAVSAAVGLLVVLPLGGLATWAALGVSNRAQPEPTPSLAPAEAPPEDAATLDLLAEEPELPEAAEPEVTQPKPKPAPKPRAARPAEPAHVPPPAPEPEVSAQGRVVVTGEAERVVLVGSGGERSPGLVPAGTYEVRASFAGGSLQPAGSVTVSADQVVTLRCRAGLKRCASR